MVEAGDIRPVVGERFPLERAGEALEALERRVATGKIVLDVRAP
jgi:NADPH2:quinone reductase